MSNVKPVQERRAVIDNKVTVFPPIDYSFKDLDVCADILNAEPRKGLRKKLKKIEEEKVAVKANQNNNTVKFGLGARDELKKLFETEDANLVIESTKQEDHDTTQDLEQTQEFTGYLGTSLKLSNNNLQTLDGLPEVLEQVMHTPSELKYLDLSYNHIRSLVSIEQLDYDLEALQLHSNEISSINEVVRLRKFQNLKTLTLHGNTALEETKNYRFCVIAILPWLRSLDFNIITKKDRDTAETFRKLFIEPMVKRQVAKQMKKKQTR